MTELTFTPPSQLVLGARSMRPVPGAAVPILEIARPLSPRGSSPSAESARGDNSRNETSP